MPQCIINTYQKVLGSFNFNDPSSFSEAFAQERYKKKYQRPDASVESALHKKCWDEWITSDGSLPEIMLPSKEWYLARDFLHKNLGVPILSSIGFPKGSEFIPTKGKNSLEAKLSSSVWTCTYDNFELFSSICYEHKGLKRATKLRYAKWLNEFHPTINKAQLDKFLFNKFMGTKPHTPKNIKHAAYSIFQLKLEHVLEFVQGSRFSTVPKTNEKRRPINVEAFANIVVQRTLGNWLRQELSRLFEIDLDNLASIHRILIKDVDRIATIDLKNASDRISLDLCRFLLPSRLMSIIEQCRSFMTLGLDKDFHVLKKVSSMGNGFTFELMTLILTCVAKQLDDKASVFGDDIIIQRSKASRLIELLEEVGLQINVQKTFIDGDFRESCGANYHRIEGYIKSFDFLYPETIGDCVAITNKVAYLSNSMPSFSKLYQTLLRVLPDALHGGPAPNFIDCHINNIKKGFEPHETFVDIPLFFVTPKLPRKRRYLPTEIKDVLRNYCYDEEFCLISGYEFKPKLRSSTLKDLSSRHWAKYEMYLDSGRVCKDVISGEGEWKKVWFATSGKQTFRMSTLKSLTASAISDRLKLQ